MFEVLEPGLLSTVQDAGRPSTVHLGVPVGGACDPWSLSVANALIGNDTSAAAIEITVTGPRLVALESCAIAVAGDDFGVWMLDEWRRIRPGSSYMIPVGSQLVFGGATRSRGARAYLAVPGGVAVEMVLDSASTCLSAGFGGMAGRALLAGDIIVPRRRGDTSAAGHRWPYDLGPQLPAGSATLRVVAGPHAMLLGAERVDRLLGTEWTVDPASNRTGLRLRDHGPTPESSDVSTLTSFPLVWGSVEVPPDGNPIILMADCPTIGGYPVPFVVARADWPITGQLGLGDRVRFEPVSVYQAQRAYRAQERALRQGLKVLEGSSVASRV